MLDYNSEHYCPVYSREIDPDLCYDSILCLSRMITITALPALDKLSDIESARKKCRACPYSDLSGGMDEYVPEME